MDPCGITEEQKASLVVEQMNLATAEFGTHIGFIPDKSYTGKTSVWSVINRYGDGLLGVVKWFGRWRKYGFFPNPDTVYEEVCLREIAVFCQSKTRQHRGAKKKSEKSQDVTDEES